MAVKNSQRTSLKSLFNGEVLKNVFSDRTRTNLLKKQGRNGHIMACEADPVIHYFKHAYRHRVLR